jgi:hypothetical protein
VVNGSELKEAESEKFTPEAAGSEMIEVEKVGKLKSNESRGKDQAMVDRQEWMHR